MALRASFALLGAAVAHGAPLSVVTPQPAALTTASINVNGVFPSLAHTANAADVNRSECGHGALLAWNDKLYVITYLSVPYAGSGTGLYAIDANMNQELIAPHNSTYANRMLHPHTQQAVIGEWTEQWPPVP